MSEYSIIKKGIFDSARSDFPFADQYIIARKDDKKLLQACEEAITEENIKAVHVVDTEVIETLYGMEEQKFIENAVVLER